MIEGWMSKGKWKTGEGGKIQSGKSTRKWRQWRKQRIGRVQGLNSKKKKENKKKRRETGKRGWNREDWVLKVGRKVEREVDVRESGKENEGE